MRRCMRTGGTLFSLLFLALLSVGSGETGGPVVFLKEHHFNFKVIFQNIPGRSEKFKGILRLNTNYPERTSILIWMWGGPITTPKPS